jgi:hypothetical protein
VNERIRELAKQAGAVFEKTNGLNDCPQDSLVDDEIEKFALLIIRECARVAIAKQTENDIDNIVSKNPAKDFAYALIEHFGVESA